MTRTIDGTAIDAVLQAARRDAARCRTSRPSPPTPTASSTRAAPGCAIAGESDDPVGTSTQFRIMSMTKMVCTAAALQQKERGDLDLDAPVEDYCPEFADVQGPRGWDGDEPDPGRPATKATVHQLVTHTSGLGYWFWNDQLVKFEAATGVPNVVPGSDGRLQGADDRRTPASSSSTASTPTGSAGSSRPWPGKKLDAVVRGGHHRPARDERHDVPPRRAARDNCRDGPRQGRGRHWGSAGEHPQPRARLVGRRSRPLLDPARLHPLRARPAPRRRARRRPHPRARTPSTRPSATRSATSTSRRRSRPPTRPSPTPCTPARAGSGATA